MPWMPAPARRRKIAWLNSLPRYGSKPTAIVLHITASEATSQHGYFSSIRFAGSHFHVARSGVIEQYAGTGARSAADLSSRRTISIETQGVNGPWTKAQLEAIAQVVAWCARTHGIPLRKMTSSSLSQHGVGWHRLGVDGNFPSGPLGGRLQRGGGEKWSGSRGKACPTDACIHQIDDVIARAIEINKGGSKPAAPIQEKDWFDMATKADLREVIEEYVKSPAGRKALCEAVWNTDGVLDAPADTDTKKNPHWGAAGFLRAIRSQVRDLAKKG
ncbi:N-acetylmuramoyl-L-alanine amidase [Isoptericola sp. NPDC056134]|uniref:peptidoglycan recognition protein family protein n=1 Tax=Isoptericola sp. NPDC056134 TaxID=3345723 RepID=UPI0035E90C89